MHDNLTDTRLDAFRSYCFFVFFISIIVCCPVNICGMSDALTSKRIYIDNFNSQVKLR